MRLSRWFAVSWLPVLLTLACGGDPSGEPAGAAAPDGPTTSPTPDASTPAPSPPSASPAPRASGCATVFRSVTTLSIPTVWKNGPEACDYLIDGTVSVNASLTIEPGTVIQVAQDGSLFVSTGAFLVAVGRPDARIRFLGAQDIQGFWNGISLVSNRDTNRLEYVDVENAGQAATSIKLQAGVFARGPLSFKHNRIAKSFAHGADLAGAKLQGFEANVFEGNRYAGLVLSRDQVVNLDAASDYLGRAAPNDEPYIKLRYDTHEQPATWRDVGAPFFMDIGVVLRAPLALEAGVTIVMDEGDELVITSGGSLTASGTAQRPVVFTGKVKRPGSWAGLDFTSSKSPNNRLEHVRIEYTGLSSPTRDPVAVQVHGSQGSTLALSHVTFANVSGDAICQRSESTVMLGESLLYETAGATRPVTPPLPQCRFY